MTIVNFCTQAESGSANARVRPWLVATWLALCLLILLGLVAIGPTLRASLSDLPDMDWQPTTHLLPPAADIDWRDTFKEVKRTPAYKAADVQITFKEFKKIYMVTWFEHTSLMFLIGLTFIPFLIFWLIGAVPVGAGWMIFAAISFLGLEYGHILSSAEMDTHYHLAMHTVIFGAVCILIVWATLGTFDHRKKNLEDWQGTQAGAWLYLHGLMGAFFLIVAIIWGAFVTGLDAGLIYNQFPVMGEARLVPKEMWDLSPSWMNFVQNDAAVQFTHRWLGMGVVLLLLSFAAHAMLAGIPGAAFPAMAVMALLQTGLGIMTLLSNINLYAQTVHLIGALILLGLMTACLRSLAISGRSFLPK